MTHKERMENAIMAYGAAEVALYRALDDDKPSACIIKLVKQTDDQFDIVMAMYDNLANKLRHAS